MSIPSALTEIEVLKSELEAACDALMTSAQRGLELATNAPVDAASVMETFAEILSLCAFQDLAGQRLDRLERQITGKAVETRPDAALLNGPANGDGLDQAAADALFGILPTQ